MPGIVKVQYGFIGVLLMYERYNSLSNNYSYGQYCKAKESLCTTAPNVMRMLPTTWTISAPGKSYVSTPTTRLTRLWVCESRHSPLSGCDGTWLMSGILAAWTA